jgi:hypothetical protein
MRRRGLDGGGGGGVFSVRISPFQRYPQSKDILIISVWNAQGSRLIIILYIYLGAVKIYVEAVEALRKNERRDETEFTTKIEFF